MADEPLLKLCGRYAVCDVIGSGGMATVHIGKLLGPVGFSRTVAIKRMHPHLTSDPAFVAMFLEEARVAARVQHANVVSTLDVVTEAGELFLVMEYVEGESFARVLRTVGKKGVRLPHPIVGAVISQTLHGLHAVHEARDEAGRSLGLIHRDVSPDNILIGSDGLARVLDFGIAKATEHGRRTLAGKIKGKVAYMAPEQMRGKDLDRRADIYGASAMLWEALTGSRLLKGANDVEMIHAALSSRPAAPSSIVPSIRKEVDEIVLKGLSQSPDDRYATAREMGIAVERAFGLASPTTVAQLIEGMLGASLAQRAALVANAMRRTGDLEKSAPSAAPSSPQIGSLPLDSANFYAEVTENPRALLGPPTPHPVPRALAPAKAVPALAGPFAPVDLAPRTRASGSVGSMPFSELLASGGTDPEASGDPIAAAAEPRAGTELMLDTPRAPAAHGTAPQPFPKSGTMHMPDLLTRGGHGPTRPSAGISAKAAAHDPVAAPVEASLAPLPQGELPSLELDKGSLDMGSLPALPAPSTQARPERPAAAESKNKAVRSLDVDFGNFRAAAAARSAAQRSAPQPSSSGPGFHNYGPWGAPEPRRALPLVVGLALATMILAAVALYVLFGRGDAKPTVASSRPPQTPAASSACDLLRRRIYAGGQATGLSREGWVAELWLRGPNGAAIDTSKIDVAALRGSDPASGAETAKLTPPGKSTDEGVVVRLWGPAAESAFDSEGAERLIKQADLTFEQANAEAGALYLKCSHLPHHDVGIWFRAGDVTTAASSVLFAMGVFAEKAVIKDGALDGPNDVKTVFERGLKKLQSGRTEDLELEIQRYGGSVQTPPSKRGTRIVFPTDRMPDAVRLSRVIADRAGVENL